MPSIKGFQLEDLNILLILLQEKQKKTNQDTKRTLPGALMGNDLFSINSPSNLNQKTEYIRTKTLQSLTTCMLITKKLKLVLLIKN